MDLAMKGPSSCSSLLADCAQYLVLPYFGTPSLQRVRVTTSPRDTAPRTAQSTEDPVATPADDNMQFDEDTRHRATVDFSASAESLTIIADLSEVTVSDEQKATNEAMEAEMAAEIQADQDSGTSLAECIIDPPERVADQPDYRPDESNSWTARSDTHVVFYWTSAPLMES
eukprot:6359186-Pyramimonas_sp.AAC.1